MPPRILCSAIWYQNGESHIHQPKNIGGGFVICGRRHHNCFATAKILNLNTSEYKVTQGFLTDKDVFVNRREAHAIAVLSGQAEPGGAKRLISEDLY